MTYSELLKQAGQIEYGNRLIRPARGLNFDIYDDITKLINTLVNSDADYSHSINRALEFRDINKDPETAKNLLSDLVNRMPLADRFKIEQNKLSDEGTIDS